MGIENFEPRETNKRYAPVLQFSSSTSLIKTLKAVQKLWLTMSQKFEHNFWGMPWRAKFIILRAKLKRTKMRPNRTVKQVLLLLYYLETCTDSNTIPVFGHLPIFRLKLRRSTRSSDSGRSRSYNFDTTTEILFFCGVNMYFSEARRKICCIRVFVFQFRNVETLGLNQHQSIIENLYREMTGSELVCLF